MQRPATSTMNLQKITDIQNDLNLCSTQTKKLATHIRSSAIKRRNIIEPNLKQKLIQQSHKFENFFEQTTIHVSQTNKTAKQEEMVARPLVYCKKLE